MNGADPASLDRLHDIVVPPPVPWWPPAPGWYLLAALAMVFVVALIVRHVMIWRANAYRRAALAELNLLARGNAAAIQAQSRLQEAAAILKRTALAAAPREEVAMLSGEVWIDWLNERGSGVLFQGDVAQLLEHTIYKTGNSDVSEDALRDVMETIRAWIVRHRVDQPDSERY